MTGKQGGLTRSVLLWILTVGPVSASAAYGDEIEFVNGDRLSGTIKQLTEGKLVIETEVAGEVTVDVSKVATLRSDEPVAVHLAEGSIVRQRLVPAERGLVGIEGGPTLEAQQFRLGEITAINPPAKPEPRWHGDISAGLTSTHGNTASENRNFSAALKRRSENDRITVRGDYARGEQEDPDTGEKKTTENWWRSRAKYDYFLSKKFFVYGDTRYEKDSIAELDRRIVAGGGAGYQWIESDDMNFSTEAGLASVYEKFEDETDSNSELSVQAGYHFDKKLYEGLQFINELTYYPAIDKVSDYYLTTTAELRASITGQMFTNFKVIFDYDATPAQDAGSTDVKYILGAGMSF